MIRQAPFCQHRPAPADDPGHPLRCQGYMPQEQRRVKGEVIHALLGLFDQRIPEDLQFSSSGRPPTFSSA